MKSNSPLALIVLLVLALSPLQPLRAKLYPSRTLPSASIEGGLRGNNIFGLWFTPSSSVTIEIYAKPGGSRLFGPVRFPTDEGGFMGAPYHAHRVNLTPGMVITATDDATGIQKTLELQALSVEVFDMVSGHVEGHAPPFSELGIEGCGPDGLCLPVPEPTQVDAQGFWSVDFSPDDVELHAVGVYLGDNDGDLTATTDPLISYSIGRVETFFGQLERFDLCTSVALADLRTPIAVSILNPNGEEISRESDLSAGALTERVCAEFGSTPPPVGTYTVLSSYLEGPDQLMRVPVLDNSTSSTTPVIIHPAEGDIVTNGVPTFSWEPFRSPERGQDERLTYLVELFRRTSEGVLEPPVWQVRLPETVNSTSYNFDGAALDGFEELPPGGYTLYINALEERGKYIRISTRYSNFVVGVEVQIDIKPGSDPNCFNNDGHGVIPVAVIGSAQFDVTTLDPATITLDGQPVRSVGKGKLQAHLEDVNGDGIDDLVLQIEDIAGTYSSGDTTGTLTGQTYDGRFVEGSDTICLVP